MFYLILCVFLEIMDDLTKRIVELAYTKFLQFGIRRISIDDICNELRISKKTFYRIFPKKEDLVEEALKYRNELAIEKFKKMIRNKNAIDSLVATMKFIKDHIDEECSSFFYDISKYYPSIFVRFQEYQSKRLRESFTSNLKQGIAEGFYREDLDVELISIFYAVQLKNSYKDILTIEPKITKKRLMEFYNDVTIRLITNDKGLKYVEDQLKRN